MINVAETIRQCRKFRGMTQAELAEKAGIHVSLISYYENNKTCPSVNNFEDLMNAMGFGLTITTRTEK